MKVLFKNVKEEQRARGKNFPALSIELFDKGGFYDLSQEETRALLQEAIYLLRDKSETAEAELMEAIEEWHPEHFEEEDI